MKKIETHLEVKSSNNVGHIVHHLAVKETKLFMYILHQICIFLLLILFNISFLSIYIQGKGSQRSKSTMHLQPSLEEVSNENMRKIV